MTEWFDRISPLVTVTLVLGVAVALNVRYWCMSRRVPFKEYPLAFLLVAWVTRYRMLLRTCSPTRRG